MIHEILFYLWNCPNEDILESNEVRRKCSNDILSFKKKLF